MRTAKVTVMAVALLNVSISANAISFFKKKKQNKNTTAVVKKDAYERILTEEKTDSAKGPFISLYRTNEKLLALLHTSDLLRKTVLS